MEKKPIKPKVTNKATKATKPAKPAKTTTVKPAKTSKPNSEIIINILSKLEKPFSNFYERLENADITVDEFYNLRIKQSDNRLEFAINKYNNQVRKYIFNEIEDHPSPSSVFVASLKERYTFIPDRVPVSHDLLETMNQIFDQISVGNVKIETAIKIIDVYQSFSIFRENEHLIREHSDTALKLYHKALENFVLEKPAPEQKFENVEIKGVDLPNKNKD